MGGLRFKTGRGRSHFTLIALPLLLVVSLVVWQAATALADAPLPNKLDPAPAGSVYAPVTGADIGAPGAAASIQVDATQKDNFVTYKITLANQGANALGHLDVRDTLPAGVAYVSSYLPDVGQNPGSVSGSTVEWINDSGVPQCATLGPFVIVAQVTGVKPPPNTVQLLFNWTGLDGTVYSSSAVSDPVVPKSERAKTATPVPVAAQPAMVGVQVVQPSEAALSWGYAPPTITIHVGDTVIWTNQGSLQHSVTADDGSFDSGLFNTIATWSMAFNTAGTYNYHCSPHPWMKGSVVVQ